MTCVMFFAVEGKTVRVQFKEGSGKKTYAIQWTELLNVNETPFSSFEELVPGTEVLAPYYQSDGKINFSCATVVNPDKDKFQGTYCYLSLVLRLTAQANKKSKGKGEPSKLYHIRNITGRENLVTAGE